MTDTFISLLVNTNIGWRFVTAPAITGGLSEGLLFRITSRVFRFLNRWIVLLVAMLVEITSRIA